MKMVAELKFLKIVLLTIWTCCLLAAAPLVQAAPGPRATIPETTFNFGEILEDRELSHTFAIQNTGDAPLEIRGVDPDCACTAADYDRRIPPGGQGRMRLTIASYSVLRQFTKETKVFLNDPARPEITLRLTGYGKPVIDLTPSHVIRLRGKPGEAVEGQVRVVSHLSGPLEITGAVTDTPHLLEFTLKPEQPGKVYLLTVRNRSSKPGNYAGKVELTTTSKHKPRLIIRVFGELAP